jgi:hypothetical protein
VIIDPTDPNVAVDESDGDVMCAVRMLIRDGARPPTVDELRDAPIVGYARSDAFTYRRSER